MELITQPEFAKRVGASRSAVRDAVQRGKITLMPQKDGKMRIPWPDAVEQWENRASPEKIATGKPNTPPAAKPKTWADAKSRKDIAEAEIKELELAKRKGELVEKTKIEAEAFECARRTRDAIMNVPNRIADILASETDRFKVHGILEKELIKALSELQTTPEADNEKEKQKDD